MTSGHFQRLGKAGCLLAVLTLSSLAGVIDSGFMRVGINPYGSLYDYPGTEAGPFAQGQYYWNGNPFGSTATGVVRNADNWSPFRSVSFQDNWAITASSTGPHAAVGVNPGFGLVTRLNYSPTTSFFTTNRASVTGTTTFLLDVTHEYSFAAPNILAIDGLVTNRSATVADVTYKRGINWTIGSSPYADAGFAPAIPSGSPVIDSTIREVSYGLGPLVLFSPSCASGCSYTPSSGSTVSVDIWSGMRLYLGMLNPGESVSFRLYYGISQIGQDTNNLVAQLQGLGATYWVVAHSPDNTLSAIMAFGSRPTDVVPEHSSVATWATAALGLGYALLRRRVRKNDGGFGKPTWPATTA